MGKILVAVDGSKHSLKAVKKAKLMAVALGSELTLINVVNPTVELKSMHNKQFYDEVNKNTINQGKTILNDALLMFEDFKGKINAINKTGDVAEEIIKYAEEGEFDLVIMGCRGVGVFSRTLLGSVSDKVIHHVKTSVLIVK